MSLFVFIIITSNKCGHCQNMKNSKTLENIVRQAKNITGINSVIEINLNELNDPIPGHYPKSVENLKKFYPSFFLVTDESWEKALKFNTPLDCDGYNMIVEKGVVIGSKPRDNTDGALTPNDISEWIIRKIAEKNEEKNQNIYYNKSSTVCTGSSGNIICLRRENVRN